MTMMEPATLNAISQNLRVFLQHLNSAGCKPPITPKQVAELLSAVM
jgi:hypothetical protein